MSYAAIWSGRRNYVRLILPGALLVCVLVAMAPRSMASDSKSSAKAAAPAPHPAAPAPHPAAPAAHPNTYPGATGSRPPSSNGVSQRPPSSNSGTQRPPSSNGMSTRPPSANGTSTRPPSTNSSYPPSGRPPSSNAGNNSYAPHNNSNPPNAARSSQPNVGTNRTPSSPGSTAARNVTHVQLPNGASRTTQRLPSGSRVVQTQTKVVGGGVERVTSYSSTRGVVERPVFGHPCCVRRSYLVGNRSYAVVYRGYAYRGVVYYRPVPAYVYSPAYYAWTVQPWGPPVVYGWGWAGQPWYVAYGGVFTPYPAYSNFDGWMTDYVISSNLQQAYDAGRADGTDAAQSQPPQITPEMKQQIASQVEDDLKNQQQQAQAAEAASQPNAQIAPVTDSQDTPEALQTGHVLFRVVSLLNVSADGQDCVLNTDDWVTRTSGLDGNNMVSVQVKASRAADCHPGANTQIALSDLMVMEGDFQEQVRNGLQYASKNMGKNGMPQGPDPGAAPVALGTTVADANLSERMKQQQADADNDESHASAQGGSF